MILIYLVVAGVVAVVGVFMFPLYTQLYDAMEGIAISLIPSFGGFDSLFFTIMPYVILLFGVWFVIIIALGKTGLFGGGGGEGGE